MNVVILGATKGMGQALARRMAERGDRLFLLGRNADDLGAAGKDLEVRGATGEVGHAHCDLDAPEGFEVALNTAWAALERVDTAVVTAGLFATQEELEADPELAAKLTRVNFANTVVFCEHARKRLGRVSDYH